MTRGEDSAVLGSIREQATCGRGAALLRQGSIVGSLIRGVCGIWVDGNNPAGIQTAYRIKGEQRGSRPFGVILDAEALAATIDPDRIAPSIRSLFLDPRELAARLGSICFIRYPIREELAETFAEALVSRSDGVPWLQSWLPEGCGATEIWLRELTAIGVRRPVASSMNVSGQPELVDQREGLQFCLDHGIPLFLGDPQQTPAARGSFPILQVDHAGIKVLREGHFPATLFDVLLREWDVDRSHVQRGKYPLVSTHSEEAATSLHPHQLRLEMIARLDGASA
jgi:hypothetical protein